MEAGKAQARHVLTTLGFLVEDIPLRDGRSADLKISDDESIYHIEVKEKFESPQLAADRAQRLNRGELFEQADLLAYDNRISGILRDAKKQLDETPKDASEFQLIWFHADGIDADLKFRQAFATFYGMVSLIALHPRRSGTTDCLYFDYCESIRMPTVEALILSDADNLQVCLNEFSERRIEFQSTRFFKTFSDLGGVFDPVALVEAGQLIACRAAISRKEDAEIERALQIETGVLYTSIRLTRHSCSAAIISDKAIDSRT